MGRTGTYKPGQNLAVCDRCGRTRYSGDMLHTWDRLLVCADTCYENRHPQDFYRTFPDTARVNPSESRPQGTFQFQSLTVLYGDDLITNGGFDTDSGWTLDSQWTITGGQLVRTPADGDPATFGSELVPNGLFTGNADGWLLGAWLYDSNQVNMSLLSNISFSSVSTNPDLSGPEAGADCLVAYDLVDHEPSGSSNWNGDSAFHTILGGSLGTNRTANGSYSDIIAFGDGGLDMSFRGSGTGTAGKVGLDNVSVKEILSYSPLGADDAEQTFDAGTLLEDATYRLIFTVVTLSGGTVTPSVAGTDGDAISTAGTKTVEIVAGRSGGIKFAGSESLTIKIDNVSLEKILGNDFPVKPEDL